MAHFGEFLTKGGALEIIRRVRGLKEPLQKAEATLATLVEGVAKIAKRVAVNTLAIRVLDIEVLERDAAIWKKIKEVEDAALGGSLDDYEKKEDAEQAHEELQTAIDAKQSTLTAGDGIEITDESVISCTVEVEAITADEIGALFG